MSFLEDYFKRFSEFSPNERKMNYEYFQALYEKFKNPQDKDITLYEGSGSSKNVAHPFAILDESERSEVQHYSKLDSSLDQLKNFELLLCKMHAGIGSSVKRLDHLKKYTDRTDLGSKGCDLFMNLNSKNASLAELQLLQAEILSQKNIFKKVSVLNLVNEETAQIVNSLFKKTSLLSGKKYEDTLSKEEDLFQFKLPTINSKNELNDKRIAPAGHAYLGFNLLSQIYKGEKRSALISIGNGEDINSTADNKILAWIVEKNIPITMLTTTKLSKDKKGGQISKVFADSGEYLTIVEKAQAEKAGQLKYFEELGLRDNDNPSLFNTNIAIINTKALKEVFDQVDFKNENEFFNIIAPDLIKNSKEQDGEMFIQLEGALGSSLLNLDQFMRTRFNKKVVRLLNLDESEREMFFLPIKKMEDFFDLEERFEFDMNSGRLVSRK